MRPRSRASVHEWQGGHGGDAGRGAGGRRGSPRRGRRCGRRGSSGRRRRCDGRGSAGRRRRCSGRRRRLGLRRRRGRLRHDGDFVDEGAGGQRRRRGGGRRGGAGEEAENEHRGARDANCNEKREMKSKEVRREGVYIDVGKRRSSTCCSLNASRVLAGGISRRSWGTPWRDEQRICECSGGPEHSQICTEESQVLFYGVPQFCSPGPQVLFYGVLQCTGHLVCERDSCETAARFAREAPPTIIQYTTDFMESTAVSQATIYEGRLVVSPLNMAPSSLRCETARRSQYDKCESRRHRLPARDG